MSRIAKVVSSLALLVAGCSNPFPEVTDIDGPRTLAVSIHVVGDGERASPSPGESIHVEFVVADEGPRLGRAFAMVVCASAPSDLDVGVCGSVLPGGRIVGSTLGSDTALAPSFEFVLPGATVLEGVSELLVHGAICAGGELPDDLALEAFPSSFETDDPCLDASGVGEYVVFRIPLEVGAPNQLPRFDSLLLDGEPWIADAPVDGAIEGCVDAGLPTLPADRSKRIIEVTLASDARESFLSDHGEQIVERPLVAFYATEGDFEGAYAFFSEDAPREIVYRTRDDEDPTTIPADGRLARFVFVVRDGRGGSEAITRALCITPTP